MDLEKKKIDLRIVKTKKSLYEALLSLMEQEAFEEIKVSEICTLAMVNRSTFYAHFEDKYTLLDALIKDLKEELSEELEKNHNISNTKEYYMEVIRLLLDHVEEQERFYMPILVHNRNSIAMDMIYDTLNEDITKRMEIERLNPYKDVPSEFVSRFYLGAVFNLGMEWIKNQKYSRADLLHYLDVLIPENPSC